MRDIELFKLALNLPKEWIVKDILFSVKNKQLDMKLDFIRGTKFTCPSCEKEECNVHDTSLKKWRHLNFFEHTTYLEARVPRIKCQNCGVKLITVPWANSKSGFTHFFEMYILTLAKEMPILAISRLVREHDTRLWRIIKKYVSNQRELLDHSEVTQIGVDETSKKRGHNYITTFVDLNKKNIIYIEDGKDSSTFKGFCDDFIKHNGDPEKISDVSIDMSPAFIKGSNENLENANITFDKFHVVKLINTALDKVRRADNSNNELLKGTRYLWLKNETNLTKNQKSQIDEILNLKNVNLKTVRAYHLKLSFQEFYQQPEELADAYFKKWYYWASHSRIDEMVEVAKTMKKHKDGILRWFKSNITNGILEGLNSQIQNIKSRAKGFKNTENFKAIIYLKLGGLKNPTHCF